MTTSPWLAHISDDQKEQTILAHLQGTAAQAKAFASPFGAEEQAELAGLAHDIGKYTQAFQKRLRGMTIPVDHSTAGAVECWQMRQPFAAFAVAGHHGGLPDGGSQTDGPDQSTLWGRIKRKERGLLEPYESWRQEIILPKAGVPAFIRKRPGPEWVFFTRMLYSCLVDADFLDTEAFMEGQSRAASETFVEQLWDKLQNYLSGWFPPKGELNRHRCEILQACIRAGDAQQMGLFSLTVPTGGGKTVASLAFALAHAKRHGLRRVIYVIPYTSIIEQTAEVFRAILGAENVLEHHSNALYDLESEADPLTIRLAKATENWDMPVVVTTAVQFFESLYACRSSQCRKLHNIAGSVVIFDEAQMLPISYLRPCIWAISQLIRDYGVSAVLCTATQPALKPIFQEFLPEASMRELCPPGVCQQKVFRRVTFQQAGVLTWEALASRLNAYDQVLCIVNTRNAAREVYRRLDRAGSFHLSTLMYPSHRKSQLAEIRRRLKEGLPCRVVSTSLIEAGVDVDFPTVFRELAGLDSILQAAGRCNREGKLQKGDVYIFETEERVPRTLEQRVQFTKAARQKCPEIAAPECIGTYYRQFYTFCDKDEIRSNTIARDAAGIDNLPFRTYAENFRFIQEDTVGVVIPTDDTAKALLAKLESGKFSVRRKLQRYTVSLRRHAFSKAAEAGILCERNGVFVLADMAYYEKETGLNLEHNGDLLWDGMFP